MDRKEEEKLEMATGGISEEEEKLLQALHLLGIKPRFGSVEDVTKLLHAFSGKEEKHEQDEEHTDPFTKYGANNYPKLSVFYGEEGKGETTWETFKYEIQALLCEKIFKEEQILLGIRRACKGKSSDKIRRLGPNISVKDIIDKFDSDYGSVEFRESIMRKFYGCQQNPKESVASYASRLESYLTRQ